MKNEIKLFKLRIKRDNKLIEMSSFCDQCLRNGYPYLPEQRDLDEIDRLDEEILKLTKDRGIVQ